MYRVRAMAGVKENIIYSQVNNMGCRLQILMKLNLSDWTAAGLKIKIVAVT